jgi:predicted O-linked N-acetylglucosamine transferase (SPINDLY family)
VSYLGFPGSSGADFIDYILTDRLTTPPDHAQYFSEKLVYLPDSFMATDDRQPISDRPYSRGAFGIPEDAFVFCSFNNPYKIDSPVFDCWMRILHQVPAGILWLFGKNGLTMENLRRQAADRNISPDRLVFAEKVPLPDHLARLRLADLALDTWCYNGGATTVNALWAGVPVISLAGGHFVSRMSSCCLSAIGLPELITTSPEGYEALSIRLAGDPDALRRIKGKLAANRLTQPLFDTGKWVSHLEQAFERMWAFHLAGNPPEQIEI